MADLAREALQVQDACNLSGVVLGFGRAVSRLRKLLEAEGKGSTDQINRHPVCVLWTSKIESLVGETSFSTYSKADDWARAAAGVAHG